MNILTQKFNTKYETAPFQEIKEENYLPAFQKLIAQSEKEIDTIANNPAEAKIREHLRQLWGTRY